MIIRFMYLWETHSWAISLIVVAGLMAIREIVRGILGLPD